MSLILREYQEQAVADIGTAWETHRRVLLALPTGGGKTEVAIAIAVNEIIGSKRVLVIVERKNLVLTMARALLQARL